MKKTTPLKTATTINPAQSWRFRVKEVLGGKTTPLRKLPEFEGIKYIFYPDDSVIELWETIIIVLMAYTATVTPYRVAFVDTDTQGWVIGDYIIDFLFGLDVCINCLHTYYDEEMTLITNRKRIFLHYLRTWMIPDILACLPFQLILESNSSYNTLIRIAKLPRVYKLVKLAKLLRILKVIKNRNRIMRFVNFVFRISLSVERLIWFVIWLLLLLHLFTCSWVFFAKLDEDLPDNWIICHGFQDFQLWDLYVVAMYFSITTLATVGYGDITPCNNTERMVCSAMMLLGIFVYSCTIGSLTNLLSNLDHRRAGLNQKMELLTELSTRYHFNKLFFQKLTQAIEYEHRNSTHELNDLIDGLPSSLRTQLLIVIYCKMIENNDFFEGKTDHFVAWVAPQLSPVRIVEDEYVYREGEPAQEMFFVIRGEVEYVITSSARDVGYHVVKEGYYFGEEDLIFSILKQHDFTVKTSKKSEFLSLSREHFDELTATFESEALEIVALAEQRKQRIYEHKMLAEEKIRQKEAVVRHESAPIRSQQVRMTVKKYLEDRQNGEENDTSSDEETTARHDPSEIRMQPSIDLLPRQESLTGADSLVFRREKREMSGTLTFSRAASSATKGSETKRMRLKMRKFEETLETLKEMMSRIAQHIGVPEEKTSLEALYREPEHTPLAMIAESGSKDVESEEKEAEELKSINKEL